AADEWPPSTLTLLGMLARRTASDERVVAVLARAQQRHPGDFWINETLGTLLSEARPPRLEEVIRYYTAAVALRPQSPGAHFNLGSALKDKGQQDDAIAEYREALRLKKDYAEAHCNLGELLHNYKQDYDAAITAFREAIRLKKDFALAQNNLATA